MHRRTLTGARVFKRHLPVTRRRRPTVFTHKDAVHLGDTFDPNV
jgi:hypothetical protein